VMMKVRSCATQGRPIPSGPEGSSGKRFLGVPWVRLAGVNYSKPFKKRKSRVGAREYRAKGSMAVSYCLIVINR
jgi:hypothetical protein